LQSKFPSRQNSLLKDKRKIWRGKNRNVRGAFMGIFLVSLSLEPPIKNSGPTLGYLLSKLWAVSGSQNYINFF
jgi:hypothetical protein